MFSFTMESDGYIQIRILVAYVQNTSSIAVYTNTSSSKTSTNQAFQAKHHYTRSLPQVSELFQTSKCQDSTAELVKVIPTFPIYFYPMPLHIWGLIH